MVRFLMCLALGFLMFVAQASQASAQPPADEAKVEVSSKGLFSGMFGGMAEMTIRLTDQYLDYLAQPETAKKMATFQKNYYDSLIELGFDKEQAFTLVRDMGNPMMRSGPSFKTD